MPKIIYAISKTTPKINTSIELDPAKMSDINIWNGMCGPRRYEWCNENCEGRKCGYYREAKRRGIDLTAISERQAAMDTRREKRAAKALQQQKAAEKPAKPAKPPKPKKPKKPLRFAQPDKEW